MPESRTRGPQKIVPYLAYKDAPGAMDFLVRAFGFEEISRYPQPDGRIGHAELRFQDNVLMLASVYEEMGFAGVPDLAGVHSQITCYVDDVEAHFERARDAGATIAAEPHEDHGSRLYRAMDPEGHRWIFMGPELQRSE